MPQDTTHEMQGLDEILPWLFIADDDCSVIVNKDSSLLASWEFQGVDIEAGHQGMLEDASHNFDMALRNIADYQPVVWTRLDRRPVDGYQFGDFPDPVSHGIDRIWGDSVLDGLYDNRHYLSLGMQVTGGAMTVGEATRSYIDAGMKPTRAFVEAVKNKLTGSGKKIGFSSREELDVLLARFEQGIAGPIDNGSTRLEIRRLVKDEFLGFLKSTASANAMSPVAVDHYEYLDNYLSDSFIDNSYSDYIVLEGNKKKYVATFTLKKAPSNDNLQFLQNLVSLPVSLTVASCWKAVSKADSEDFFNGARTFDEMRSLEIKQLVTMAFSGNKEGGSNEPKTEIGAIAMELKNEVKQRRAVCGWLSTTVMVFADSPAQLALDCEIVTPILEQCGLVFIREREGSLSAFCTGIPGQLTEPVRWHFAEASNVTDVSPLVTYAAGVPYHPFFSEGQENPLPPNAIFRTTHNTPFYFNNHFGQLGHTLLIGPSRNGKTVLQMFLESQFLKYPKARIFNLDKDYSLQPQTLLLQGDYIDLDPGAGTIKINPLTLAQDEMGKSWLIGWLDRLFAHRGARLTDAEIVEVSKAVDRVVDVPGARLSSLSTQLPENLRLRLMPWCEGGAWGQYFDNSEDTFEMTRLMSVEVGGLINAGLTEVVTAFTEYAFYRIERALNNRKSDEIGPTMVYFEEAGFLLDDEIFASRARDYLMTLAKKKAFLVMTAQSPEPFVNHPALGAAVRDNVATVIFMPNKQATRELGEKYKKAFGVNDNHLQIIANIIPKRQYCIYQPMTGEFRVINAEFPPSIIAALRSDAASRALLQQLYTPGDDSWIENYLEQVQSV